MDTDIATRRRVLLLTYQRYLAAERAWNIALRDMNTWFPATSRLGPSTIGDPGSPFRRIRDHRDRAIRQLQVARLKLEVAKQRLDERRQNLQIKHIILVTHSDP